MWTLLALTAVFAQEAPPPAAPAQEPVKWEVPGGKKEPPPAPSKEVSPPGPSKEGTEALMKLDLKDLKGSLVPKSLPPAAPEAPAAFAAPPDREAERMSGWHQHPFNGRWYGLSAAGSWDEAESEARRMGGHLVTIHSMRELDWLRERFGQQPLWIGLSDAEDEGVFRWAGGDHEHFRFWSWARPDNLGEREHYVYMNHNMFGEWNDRSAPARGDGLQGVIQIDHPPRDLDADGISDDLELVLGTNPRDRDSDDDGLADGREHLDPSQGGFGTDPARWDTDGDGISDGVEAGQTEPQAGDLENDILGTNLAIFRPDEDPSSHSDPLRADSDSDGQEDGQEDLDLDGRLAPKETSPTDSTDQGLQLRLAPLRGGTVLHLEVLGAEPGARVLPMVSTSGVLSGSVESGLPDVLAGPVYTMPQVRAGKAGVVALVIDLPQQVLGTELWAQVVEIGASGVPRYSAPVSM